MSFSRSLFDGAPATRRGLDRVVAGPDTTEINFAGREVNRWGLERLRMGFSYVLRNDNPPPRAEHPRYSQAPPVRSTMIRTALQDRIRRSRNRPIHKVDK